MSDTDGWDNSFDITIRMATAKSQEALALHDIDLGSGSFLPFVTLGLSKGDVLKAKISWNLARALRECSMLREFEKLLETRRNKYRCLMLFSGCIAFF